VVRTTKRQPQKVIFTNKQTENGVTRLYKTVARHETTAKTKQNALILVQLVGDNEIMIAVYLLEQKFISHQVIIDNFRFLSLYL
jgi:hypothetical protein